MDRSRGLILSKKVGQFLSFVQVAEEQNKHLHDIRLTRISQAMEWQQFGSLSCASLLVFFKTLFASLLITKLEIFGHVLISLPFQFSHHLLFLLFSIQASVCTPLLSYRENAITHHSLLVPTHSCKIGMISQHYGL